ncbi:hypothetical protein [Halomonas beimenensis]|uniref:Uncharacterized protein n=1 Tax=Halomonas beimenensis TaxID=475662 RepID=A0A291P881_9GAMM|nr:hypothetical protein [Halomonas beimenensis]ATJ83079.1 hypothetical protein BEI_2092 [Halomonas beimenensis]
MSVINRIEVANLLNKHGDVASPWEAKMRHLLLDLRGQSSAISMENGFGRTTLAEALIGLLSRDRTLLTRTRRKCSPSSVGGEGRSWSHLRVEFRSRSGRAGQDDMLEAAGEEVAGETFVFGFYGYCDGSGLSFYHYTGRLEDVPVHHHTADGKLALFANRDVKAALAERGVRLTLNREEWLEAVGSHVSRRELAQLAAFQKDGGADKSQIFNAIRPRAGEQADQAFFFEVLAPEILSGATRGETDEREELIEEVILNSGTNITELRHRLEEAEADQRRSGDKVQRLAALTDQGEALLEARRHLAELDRGLAAGERLLGGRALAGLPGVPRPSEADDEVVSGFAWGAGDTGRPRVSVRLLARLCGRSERVLRRALDEAGIRLDGHRRVLHLPEADWPRAREVGHLGFQAARDWLAGSLAFDDDTDRERAIRALEEGAEAFEALDGNPFRDEVIADRLFLDELDRDLEALDERAEHLDRERERLESRQRDFIDNQSFYTQALADGLFDEAELEDPLATADTCAAEAEAARRALLEHSARVGELGRVAEWHDAFRREHPGTDPAALLDEKLARQEALEADREAVRAERDAADERLEADRDEAARLDGERQRLTGERGPLAQAQGPWEAFRRGWPDAEASGFWAARKAGLADLDEACRESMRAREEAEQRRARLAPLAEAAERYRELHGDDEPVHLRDRLHAEARRLDDEAHRLDAEESRLRDLHQARLDFAERSDLAPADWLADAKRRYPRLLSEAEQLEAAIAGRERYLERLGGDPLERRVAEAEAHGHLDAAGIPWRPLHEVLNDPVRDEPARRAWLSQAAGLLFAPVVDGSGPAREAAERLVEAGLTVPVLEGERLAERLASGESPLGAIQGVETLAVKAALDPRHLDALREATTRRLAADRACREALAEECARLDPHGEWHALALQAREAEESQVEGALEALAEAREANDARREALAPRLSEAALACIDDFQRFLQEGGEMALREAKAAAEAASRRLEELQPLRDRLARELALHGETWLAAERFAAAGGAERLAELDERLAVLEEALAEVEARRDRQAEAREAARRRLEALEAGLAGLFADGERARLRSLADFERQDGPAFMAGAEARRLELEQDLARASRRADFDFERIRAYLEVRDAGGGGRVLERDLARCKRDLKEAREARKAKERERREVQDRLSRQQAALHCVDQLGIAWLEALRQLPEGWRERLVPAAPATDAFGWPPDDPRAEDRDDALARWQALAGQGPVGEVAELEAVQQSLLDALGELNLGERARDRERQARRVAEAERALGGALEEAAQSRLFNDTERARLASLHGITEAALTDLAGLHAQLQAQLEEHRGRVGRLQASREQIEGTLVERLSSIIGDAAGNLDILKRVARRSGEGGAYFEVKASLVGGERLRELIQVLLAEIDEHQAALRRRAERDGGLGEAETGRRDEELLGQIRRRIYRGLFHDVAIRLKHDAIRPHGRLFSLNEAMSEGQREAVSLMWLVKLSEFAIERELRELPGHHKRRARASRESVILLDGLFSKLSHRRLIQDSLESLRNTRGRFQMIGLIHNPNYENDAEIFPTYLVGSVIGGAQGQGGHVMVRDGHATTPESLGRASGEASLFGIHVTAPAT